VTTMKQHQSLLDSADEVFTKKISSWNKCFTGVSR